MHLFFSLNDVMIVKVKIPIKYHINKRKYNFSLKEYLFLPEYPNARHLIPTVASMMDYEDLPSMPSFYPYYSVIKDFASNSHRSLTDRCSDSKKHTDPTSWTLGFLIVQVSFIVLQK